MSQALSQAILQDSVSYFTDDRLGSKTGIVYSSYSLFHTLFIFLAATVGSAHSDLLNAIQLTEEEAAPAKVSAMLAQLQSDNALALGANIYAKNVTPTQAFTDLAKKYFGIDIEPLKSAEQVNSWCAAQTRNLIKTIVDDVKGIDVILISAIYFKADWAQKFQEERTKEEPFTALDGTKQNRSLMSTKTKLQYHENDKAQMVRLQYDNTGVHAVIVLPRETGKDALKGTLVYENFFPTEGFSKEEVMLKLPKFKIENSHDLKGHLIARGAKLMFDACDCSGSFGVPMTVDQVIQKAIIEVDEKGTTAAAVTGMMMMRCSMPLNAPKVFRVECDRPFWFMLEREGIPLFLTAVL